MTCALLIPSLIHAQSPATPITAELSVAQRRDVEAGGQLFIALQVPGATWPRTLVYRFLDASPEEAAAVFTEYARHASYIPDLEKSVVSRMADSLTAEVDYTLDVPVLPDEDYTVRDRLRRYAVAGGEPASRPATGYRVDWTLVRATSTKATVGSVRFEPHVNARTGRTGTLMAYDNFVVPGSSMARLGLVRRQAMKQVQATAEAIASEIERQRREDPSTTLARNVARLRAVLKE